MPAHGPELRQAGSSPTALVRDWRNIGLPQTDAGDSPARLRPHSRAYETIIGAFFRVPALELLRCRSRGSDELVGLVITARGGKPIKPERVTNPRQGSDYGEGMEEHRPLPTEKPRTPELPLSSPHMQRMPGEQGSIRADHPRDRRRPVLLTDGDPFTHHIQCHRGCKRRALHC